RGLDLAPWDDIMAPPGPHPRKPVRKPFILLLFAVMVAAAATWFLYLRPSTQRENAQAGPVQPAPSVPAPEPSLPPDPFTWAAAVARVEEARGSADKLATPPELMHHDDRRRFLA